MSAEESVHLVNVHLRDASLAKLIKESGGQEYITPKGKIRIRNLLRAIHQGAEVPELISTALEQAYPEYWDDDIKGYSLAADPYIPKGGAVEQGEDTRISEANEVSDDGNVVTSHPGKETGKSARRRRRKARDRKQQQEEAERLAKMKGKADVGGSSKQAATAPPVKKGEKAKKPTPPPSEEAEESAGESENPPRRKRPARAGEEYDPTSPYVAGSESGGDDSARDDEDEDGESGEEVDGEESPAEDADEPGRAAKRKDTAGGDDAKKPAKRVKFTLESLANLRKNKQRYDSEKRPVKPSQYKAFRDDKGVEITKSNELPEHILTTEFFNAMEIFMEVNGQPCYDSEAIALGEITESEYFLIPNTAPIPICDVAHVLGGLSVFDPDPLIVAQVYGLAKKQAKDIGIPAGRRIKWAMMRTQAYVAGWFCEQKYTRYATPPGSSISDYAKDTNGKPMLVRTAYKLAAFVPFFHEFTFRTQGSTYNLAKATEFKVKAERIAESCQLDHALKYTESSDILGSAFRWIGVRRVMEVLKAATESSKIPNPFIIRKLAPPSGQAFITTTNACLLQIETAGWYEPLKHKASYKDNVLKVLAGKLTSNPWKYHAMSGAYGTPRLTEEETRELKVGREQADRMAPMAQAYAVVFLEGYDLANNKVLLRAAKNAGATFERYKQFFIARKRERAGHLDDLFSTKAFTSVVPHQVRRKTQQGEPEATEEEAEE